MDKADCVQIMEMYQEIKLLCTNQSCRSEYIISDSKMIEIISSMIMTSTPVVIRSNDAESLMEIHRMEQEIQRAMESYHIDTEKIRAMILLRADKKYQLVRQCQSLKGNQELFFLL